MAAAAAILNHNTAAAQALAGKSAAPMAASSGSSSSSGASSDSATITANDFLTLLVTEMQNQDPTADTDPNEYINQLVNVNSLEQLISINQTLTTDLVPTPGSSGTTPPSQSSSQPSSLTGGAGAQTQAALHGALGSASPSSAASLPGAFGAAAATLAPGNLSIPAANPAAQSVSQSLNGRPRVQ